MDESPQSITTNRLAASNLADGEIAVFRWSLLEGGPDSAASRRLLTAEELRRADKFVSERLCRRFAAARAGLRRVLGEAIGVLPREVAFEHGPMGKPRLLVERFGDGLHFNLAHSGDEAIVALAKRPVGVDLEQLRPRPRATAFAERWFHPEERARLAATPEPDRLAAFYRIWTAKEAALKLLGRGVGEALPRILTPEGDGWAMELPGNDLGVDRCWITRLDTDGACAATATGARPPNIALATREEP